MRVQEIPVQYDVTDDLAFRHNVRSDAEAQRIGQPLRNVSAESDFWSVHLVGAYEYVPNEDADPTPPATTEWGTAGICFQYQAGGPNFIFEETIWDLTTHTPNYVAHGVLRQRVVFHEVLHSFVGLHVDHARYGSDEGIMHYDTMNHQQNNVHLTNRQRRYIQSGVFYLRGAN